MNASRVKVSFDLNIVSAPSAAIHGQWSCLAADLPKFRIFKPMAPVRVQATFEYEADVSPVDGFDQFIFKTLSPPVPWTDAGAELARQCLS